MQGAQLFDYPITDYQFKVLIGTVFVGFSRVSNISYGVEYEEYQEGGTNDRVLLFRKPHSGTETLILEHGLTDVGKSSLQPGMEIDGITVLVMRGLVPVRSYSIERGYVSKVELSDLNATGGSVLIERIEITHSGLTADTFL